MSACGSNLKFITADANISQLTLPIPANTVCYQCRGGFAALQSPSLWLIGSSTDLCALTTQPILLILCVQNTIQLHGYRTGHQDQVSYPDSGKQLCSFSWKRFHANNCHVKRAVGGGLCIRSASLLSVSALGSTVFPNDVDPRVAN